MSRKTTAARFEIGQRTLTAVLTICITLIILAISSLAIYAIYKATGGLTTSQTTSKYDNIYNISAILSPDVLVKRGVPQRIIEQKRETCLRYVERNKPLAQREEKLYGIPTTITLAQALLESDAGESRLAREHNNHFGIKCFSRNCKKEHCVNYSDDSHKDFFKTFASIEESYRAHSLLLLKQRYKPLFQLSANDIEGWARGLQRAGYATDKRYAEKLMAIVTVLF